MRIASYISGLPGEGPGGIIERLRQWARRAATRRFAEGWRLYETDEPLPVLPGLGEAMAAASPAVRDAIRNAADAALAGRFAALGQDWPRHWPGTRLAPDCWRLDPVTGRLWPCAGVFALDIGAAHGRGLGHIRYVWELNRLQSLQPLAAEAVLSGDGAAVTLIEATLASWHAANPPFRGVAWASPRECALRVISLLVVSSFAGERLTPDARRRLGAMISAHALWLDRFAASAPPEKATRLAVCVAEHLLTLAEPATETARAKEHRVRPTLADEARSLINDDGTPADGSPGSGAFAAELLLLAAVAADAAGHPLDDGPISPRLAAFTRFVGWIGTGDGRVPAMDEDDASRALSLGIPEPRHAMSVACAISAWLGQPTPGVIPVGPHLRDALAPSPSETAPAPAGLEIFPSGGLTVVREIRGTRALTVILRHGLAAHHDDALALLADVDGQPLFVDSGPSHFYRFAETRRWVASRRAHNTLWVEPPDNDDAPRSGRRQAVQASLETASPGDRWQIAAGAELSVARHAVRHQRTVTAEDRGFSIRDRLIGVETPVVVEIAFHLSPLADARREANAVTISWPGDTTPPVRLAFETPGEILLARGGPGPVGWISSDFGVKQSACRVVWRGRIASTGALARVTLS